MGRVHSREDLLRQRALWREQGKRVVFTNGCYDLLHPGHIRLLEQARSLGDVLILALNSDASVRRFKGSVAAAAGRGGARRAGRWRWKRWTP